MPLPSAWIEHLFAKLSVRYGSVFQRQWGDADPALVKADWAEVLHGSTGESIAYALEYLPATPPNAMQFRNLCRCAPQPAQIALTDKTPADPQRVGAAFDSMRQSKARLLSSSPAQQCIDNIERIVGDGRLSSAQKHMISHCLNMPGTATRYDIKAARAVLDRVRDGDKSVSEPEITESLQATGDMRNPYSSDPRFAAWEAGS